MDGESEAGLWPAVLAAEDHVRRARFEFYQGSNARHDVLSAALNDRRQEHSALAYLQHFPSDVPTLLDPLVSLAMTHRCALEARRAIAGNRSDTVVQGVRRIVDALLRSADTDGDDYRRLAELLVHLDDKPALRALVELASASDDPEIREAGEDFSA